MKKQVLILLPILIFCKCVNGQDVDKTYQSYFLKTSSDYSKYNAVTLGSQVGKSVVNKAKSFVLYNFNQFALTDRLYASTYAEYYKDDLDVYLSNYFNAQVFMNFKVQPKFVMGLGVRHNENIQGNITQNYLQFKVEKTFSW